MARKGNKTLEHFFEPSTNKYFNFETFRNKYNINKRAMMILDRSPESFSPQNEFHLLYYYCSNLWPPGWGQF